MVTSATATGESTVPANVGDTTKMVPERDLIAVKESRDKQVADLRVELENTKKLADDRYSELLTTKASQDDVLKQVEGLKVVQANAQELQARLDAASKQNIELGTKYADAYRKRLAVEFTIDAAAIEGKTVAELEGLEQALRLVGIRRPSGIDRGATGGGTTPPKSSLEKIKGGLDAYFKQK